MMKALVAALAASTLAFGAWAADYGEKVLASFDAGTDGWKTARGATGSHSAKNGGCFKVVFPKAQASFSHSGKLDLSGWDKLKLDVIGEGDPFNFSLRAVDGDGKSYTCWYQRVAQGKNAIEYSLRGFASKVPDKGKVTSLDLSNITSIAIRVDSKIAKPVTAYIDNIRLARGTEPFMVPVKSSGGKSAAEVPGNLLTNSDFEMGLQGWGSWGQWDGGMYSFGTGKGKDARTGAASAAIICQKRGRGGIYGKFKVAKAGLYKVKFAVKGAGGATTMRYAIERNPSRFSETVSIGTDWKIVEKDWNAKAGDGALYFYHVSNGTVYIDSASVTPAAGGGTASTGTVGAGEKPSKVTLEGDRMFVNGKPYFPIGIYNVEDPKKDLAGTGMNFAFAGATERSSPQWFTKCREAGVMTTAGLTGMLRGHMGPQAGSIAKTVKSRSALLGYYLCDEPDHGRWNVTPAEIRQAHHVLKDADPDHPTIVLVMAWHRSMSYQYADAADIIASDPYSITDMDKPVRTTLWMEDGRAAKQPLWTVLQAGWDNTKPPSPAAIVGQAYSSVACGADGIFWFERKWCNRYPAQWAAIKKVSLELKEIHDDLCGKEPAAMQPKFSDRRVIGILKRTAAGMVLITVNKTLDDVGQVTVTVPGLRARQAKELFDGGNVAISRGAIKASFGPGERRVYRIGR